MNEAFIQRMCVFLSASVIYAELIEQSSKVDSPALAKKIMEEAEQGCVNAAVKLLENVKRTCGPL
jgi:hypothetical protein